MSIRATVGLLALALTTPAIGAPPGAVVAADPVVLDGQVIDCAALRARHIDKQANPKAARLNAACNGTLDFYQPPLGSAPQVRTDAATRTLGTSDINLVTTAETFPAVTQAGSQAAGNGTDVLVVYNDSINAPNNYSGMSVSTDGGITFNRLSPSPFGTLFGNDLGSPTVAWDDANSQWLAASLVDGCSAQGIGVMSSNDPSDPSSWASVGCAHSGDSDDRPILWVDNNSSSPFYGRVYIAFNDFDIGNGRLKIVYWDGAIWTEVIVDNQFTRNVHITGSTEADGTVFIFGLDEGVGAGANQLIEVYRSTDGGDNWSNQSPNPNHQAPGAGLCATSGYFYMVRPIWRYMGWGQGAVGPGGVVHYVYGRAGQVPGDLGDIYYIRSADNGVSWSSPMPLNTDQALNNNVVQWGPSITVTSQGYVLASWYDRRNTDDGYSYEFYGRLSLDNGATWLDDEPISDVLVPQPRQPDVNLDFCFAGDTNFHAPLSNDALATWTDGRNQISNEYQQDVYFDRVPLCAPITVNPDTLLNGVEGTPYLVTVFGTGGTAPYTYTLSGTLPPGLQLLGTTVRSSGPPRLPGSIPSPSTPPTTWAASGPETTA